MMSSYRRALVPGGTFFFTLVSWRRRTLLCNPDIRASLRAAFTSVRATHPVVVEAMVLLPDHLHCVWTLPEGDADYAMRWAMIKRLVTRDCGKRYPASVSISASRAARHEGVIWQWRYWEHQVRDRPDLIRCLDYLHWNSVRHGYVGAVADWPWSSFHRYVRQGRYPPGWGGPNVMVGDGGAFGE